MDAVFEELEEELVDEEIAETELDLGGEEETVSEEPYFEDEEETPLLIGGESYNPEKWGNAVSFNPNGNVLTLNGFTGEGNSIYWDSNNALTINLVGTNKICDSLYGIILGGPLTITGSGTLEVNASLGLVIPSGDLTIKGSPTITITANDSTQAFGIRCDGEFKQSGGTVTVTAGKTTFISIGIISWKGMNITGGTLTALSSGGAVLAEAGEALPEGGTALMQGDMGGVGYAAGVVLPNGGEYGELTLGSNMQLKYGQAAPGDEHTAADFNKLFTEEEADLPLYFHVEEKAANPSGPTTPTTPAARPAPSIDAGTLFVATAVSEGENSLKFTWTPENNVDGYDVFLKRCRAKKGSSRKVVGLTETR